MFTRIGNADDQEHNISTFMLEMKETAFICSNATAKSLILLDELGRATSNDEGVAIAWAVAEYLMSRQSTVLFVTHYPQLTKLAHVYPTLVQNIHLEADLKRDETGNQLLYTHKVKSGSCDVSLEYGVELAAYCGWTQDVLDHARGLETRVRSLLPDDRFCRSDEASPRSRAYTDVLDLVDKLKNLGKAGSGIQPSTALREALATVRSSALDKFQTDPSTTAEMLDLLRLSSLESSLPLPVGRACGSATTEIVKENRNEELSLLLSPQLEDARSCSSSTSFGRSSPSGSSDSSGSSSSSSKRTATDSEIEDVSSEVVARA
jgi:DNA mismatch repair ATPase MutS